MDASGWSRRSLGRCGVPKNEGLIVNRYPTPYVHRNGMGQELDPFAPLTDLGKDVAQDIIVYLQPKLMEIVKDASKTAEPMVRTVVREEVLPKVGLFTVSGMVMVGITAAFIGIWFSQRGSR